MASPIAITVPVDDGTTTARLYTAGGSRAGVTLVLAHGAGAPQTHPFMVACAEGLAARGIDIATFNFLYTERGRRLPDRLPALERCYRAVIATVMAEPSCAGNRLVIGGKSMGGRVASHLAAAGDELAARLSGLVLLGYPLHPPGKPEALRVAHLSAIQVPVLIVQGERDPFGSPLELAPHFGQVPGAVSVRAVAQGDHSLVTPKRGNPPRDAVMAGVYDAIAVWLQGRAVPAR